MYRSVLHPLLCFKHDFEWFPHHQWERDTGPSTDNKLNCSFFRLSFKNKSPVTPVSKAVPHFDILPKYWTIAFYQKWGDFKQRPSMKGEKGDNLNLFSRS